MAHQPNKIPAQLTELSAIDGPRQEIPATKVVILAAKASKLPGVKCQATIKFKINDLGTTNRPFFLKTVMKIILNHSNLNKQEANFFINENL